MLIPRYPEGLKMLDVLRVVVLIEVTTLMLPVDTELATWTFPCTWRVGPLTTGAVPIPTFDVATSVKTFATPVVFELAAMTFPVVRAFEA